MLNPAAITDALATQLALIPALAAAMTPAGSVVARIDAFHYRLGAENTLQMAVYKMPAPSLLVAWEGTLGGNFNGATIWKHRMGVYFRMGNMAGVLGPVGYEDLWYQTVNGVPTGSSRNIRYLNLMTGLDIMDTPSVSHAVDEDRIDYFRGEFLYPEIGDN
jgi:hypothetical protein